MKKDGKDTRILILETEIMQLKNELNNNYRIAKFEDTWLKKHHPNVRQILNLAIEEYNERIADGQIERYGKKLADAQQ